jgi:endonuclease/exonuclease/phosphatase family metal-dependent hydrolase
MGNAQYRTDCIGKPTTIEESAGLKVATWNVERLKHKRELQQITDACKRISADIFVLTETDSALDLGCNSCWRSLPPHDETVTYQNTESRVALCSNYEFVRQHETFDGQTAICVELSTERGTLIVYGVVIGIYGNRHKSYMEDLPRISADIERLAAGGKRICVCGDFNCSFSDNYYYTKAGRAALEDMFSRNGLELLTRNLPECIDHIAISCGFVGASAVRVEEWNLDKTLSDHKGIVAELDFERAKR